MKKSNVFKWTGFGLLALVLAGAGVFVFLNKTSSSRIVLADEAKEHSIKLHNAMGDHACDCFQPWIMNVTLSNITSTSVDVAWHSGTWVTGKDGPATYQVTYGTTSAKTSIYPTTLPTVAYIDHTVTVPNLTPNTKYYVGVKGCCLSNCERGGAPDHPKTFQQSPNVSEWTFTTLGTGTTYTIAGIIGTTAAGKRAVSAKTTAGITGVLVTLSGGASKTVTTTSTGVYSFAGLALGTYTVTPSKAGMTFNPPSKTYTALNANQSAQNFVGAGTGVLIPAAEHALMSEVAAAKLTATDVTITWKTNIPATSLVEYGLTKDYGMKSGVNAEMVYNHDIQLFDLQKGATYHARAVSYSGDNSNTATYSSDFTFKVPSFEDRIADKRIVIEPSLVSHWAMFNYELYQPAKSVTIDILTLSGKLVATLESPSSSLQVGWNKVRWDNINLNNGLYVYRMKFKTATNMEEVIQCSGLRIAR
jgi:hypothetical protein